MRGGKREGAGAPPHEPTKASRDAVRLYAAMGTPQEDIGRLLKIDVKTLYKYYREELDLGLVAANAQIGGALFKKAMGGDTTAMIFWLKTRAGFKEAKHEEKTGTDSEKLVDALSTLIDKLPN
jgi:hypothetical protein